MTEIQNGINNDLKHNKNIKIKYEISKPSYLMPSNAEKLFKNYGTKASNYSHIEENGSLSKKIFNGNNINNHRFDKNHNSAQKRRINKNNNKLKQNDGIEKKKQINNSIKYSKLTIESPVNKPTIHKRINSLHINGNGNGNKKIIKNKNNPNLNTINYKKNKLFNNKNKNSIDYSSNQRKNLNINNNTINVNNKIIDPTISSSNNLSFSSENKKSTKNENTNSLNTKNFNVQLKIEEIKPNDMYFSFNNNIDSNTINFSENDQKKINLKQNNNQIGNNTLSGKIASRAKNLNKMLEENFNNIKKERKEAKEKSLEKNQEKNGLSETINAKNISINELVYHSINSGKNNHNITRLTKQKLNKPLSSELSQKKKKMQHKTASLNRSLQLRKKNKINENLNNNDLSNNNYNNSGKKPMKVFSKNDFRQMNTSPFVRSKPAIRPKYTNYLPSKPPLKKISNNNNMKSLDKKFNSPQKDINSVNSINRFMSLEIPDKNNNNNQKKSILPKKKKMLTKRKNKSMIIDNKLKEKEIIKQNNEKDKEEHNNNNKTKKENEKDKKIIDNNSNNNNQIKKKKPARAQSQQEINRELILDNINDILEKKQKEDIPVIKTCQKKIIKLQSLCKKGFAGPGIKKTNQDNFFIYNNFNNNSNYIYMGVCDGHGMFGQDVSGYLVNTLPQNMNTNLLNLNIPSLSTEPSAKIYPIISSTFVSTNIEMTEDDRVDSSFSGSTCVSLFYTPEKLICANVGDSRCVVGKFDGKNWKSKNLSRDQKPSEQDEYERIINAGGRIESFKDENGNFIGPERVWLKDEDVPGLAMSRSFGDEIAHTVGVITEPEINEYLFLEEDKFIIIASDGLWEFISSDECIGMVKEYYLKNDIDGALNYLYKESSKRWIMEEEVIDDITILMAFLN